MSTYVSAEQQDLLKRIGNGQMTQAEYISQARQADQYGPSVIKGYKVKTDDELNAGYQAYLDEFKGAAEPPVQIAPGTSNPPIGLENSGFNGGIQEFYNTQGLKYDAYNSATSSIKNALAMGQQYGVAPLVASQMSQSQGSKMAKSLNPQQQEQTSNMPTAPGFAYMTHLFNLNTNAKNKSITDGKKEETPEVITDQPAALKSAIEIMGIKTDRNPGGVPISYDEALKAFFGDKKPNDVELAQWKTMLEQGDSTIDSKRVRRFTNHDGSITWELLNKDKTVANRFTIGGVGGAKIFAQGGYQKYTELYKMAEKKLGQSGTKGFDDIQKRMMGPI